MDAIAPLLRGAGECFAYEALHALTGQLTKSSGEVIEVRLESLRVGQLMPKMSEHYLTAIEHLAETGMPIAAKVFVKGEPVEGRGCCACTASPSVARELA